MLDLLVAIEFEVYEIILKKNFILCLYMFMGVGWNEY